MDKTNRRMYYRSKCGCNYLAKSNRSSSKMDKKILYKSQKFSILVFFIGFTEIGGNKIKGFKAIKAKKERTQTIIKAVVPNLEINEVLVLNQTELQKFLTDSKIFTKVKIRKN